MQRHASWRHDRHRPNPPMPADNDAQIWQIVTGGAVQLGKIIVDAASGGGSSSNQQQQDAPAYTPPAAPAWYAKPGPGGVAWGWYAGGAAAVAVGLAIYAVRR